MQLPPFISAQNRNSFAAYTLTERFPNIIDQILNNNDLYEQQITQLRALKEEILHGTIPQEQVNGTSNAHYWQQFLEEHTGKLYYDAPFFETESYIYYRIAQITAFDSTAQDVFFFSKIGNLKSNTSFVANLAAIQSRQLRGFSVPHIKGLVLASLWGNSADLSQLTHNEAATEEGHRKDLLIDDSEELCHYIASETQAGVIEYVADNAGLELITDLFLIDYILHHQKAAKIVLHVKQYPTFVSDAIVADVMNHLIILEAINNHNCTQFVTRIRKYMAESELIIRNHTFWNTGLPFTMLPTDLREAINKSALTIIKGDANYRRLFEDRNWPMITPVDIALDYLSSCNIAAVRTLKSEIMLGMTQVQIDKLAKEDSHWLTNGKYGVIMFRKSRVPTE